MLPLIEYNNKVLLLEWMKKERKQSEEKEELYTVRSKAGVP